MTGRGRDDTAPPRGELWLLGGSLLFCFLTVRVLFGYSWLMDLYQKISVLGPSAQYDTCGPKDFGQTTNIPGVYHAKVNGGICRLFKVLQNNHCVNNCTYCAFRRDRNCVRARTSPAEMAKAFDSVYSRRLVDGLFLSSGVVGNSSKTMTEMLDTVNLLRDKYNYQGYVHLKLMPETPLGCLQEAFRVSNRISLNIESPTEEDLKLLSPEKSLRSGFFKTLNIIKNELKRLKFQGKRTPSVTTQFVAGAGKEKDSEILRITHLLYKSYNLKRVFYSAFRPIKETPLENRPAASLVRHHRLYQADWLMRFYKFLPEDIALDEDGFLLEAEDPKMAWARKHPEAYPVNLNKAGYWQLLKVPGIGPASAKKIMEIRKESRIRDFYQLRGKRFQVKKIQEFICF